MRQLFPEEYNEAEALLLKKGLYFNNMVGIYNDQYEVSDDFGNVVIDHLNFAQVCDLAKLLNK